MSVGDWFTLRPLNIISRQEIENELNNIRARLSSVESSILLFFDTIDQIMNNISGINATLTNLTNRVETLETNVNFLIDTVAQNSQDIVNINLRLQQLQDLPGQVNNLQNQVNNLQSSIDNLTNIINSHANQILQLTIKQDFLLSLYNNIGQATFNNWLFTGGVSNIPAAFQLTWLSSNSI
jgi:chromosome segregation ATPase